MTFPENLKSTTPTATTRQEFLSYIESQRAGNQHPKNPNRGRRKDGLQKQWTSNHLRKSANQTSISQKEFSI